MFENWHFTSKNTCLTFHSPVHTVCFCSRVVQHWPKKCTNSHPPSFTPSFRFRPFLRSRLFHLSFSFSFFFLTFPHPPSLSLFLIVFLLPHFPFSWPLPLSMGFFVLFCFVFFSIISSLFSSGFISPPACFLFFFIYLFCCFRFTSSLSSHSSWFVPLMLPVTIFPFFLLQSLALPRLPDIKLEIWWAVSTIKTWCLFSWAYFCFWLQPGLHMLNNN